MSPRALFGTLAFAEAFTWVLLLTGMYLKYIAQTTDVMVSIGGAVHGFAFLAYVAVAILVWISQRWPARVGVLALIASVLPLATVPHEIWAARKGYLDGRWQLAPGGREPRHAAERLIALALRRPVLSGAVTLLIVAVVFAALMVAGPPGG